MDAIHLKLSMAWLWMAWLWMAPHFQKQFKQLPKRYNEKTELTAEVPAGGNTSADFEVNSK